MSIVFALWLNFNRIIPPFLLSVFSTKSIYLLDSWCHRWEASKKDFELIAPWITFWSWMRCYLLRFECLYSMSNFQTWHINSILFILHWSSYRILYQQLGGISYKDYENKLERYRYNRVITATYWSYAYISHFRWKIEWNYNEKFWIFDFADSRRINRKCINK